MYTIKKFQPSEATREIEVEYTNTAYTIWIVILDGELVFDPVDGSIMYVYGQRFAAQADADNLNEKADKLKRMKDYQNYQIVRDRDNEDWVEYTRLLYSPAEVINFIKENISLETIQRQKHIVEFWNDDFITGEDEVEWVELDDFIAEYLAVVEIKKSARKWLEQMEWEHSQN